MAVSATEAGPGDELMAFVAADVVGDQGRLHKAMHERIRLAVPELFVTSALEQALRVSSAANLDKVYQLLIMPASYDAPTTLPREAHELTTACVRHGVPIVVLLEAWRVGQAFASDWWRHRVEERAPDQTLLIAAVDAIQLRISAYADSATAEIRVTYDRERRAWEGTLSSRRMRMVRSLLAGHHFDRSRASAILNYPLDRAHTAGVVWQATPESIEHKPLESVVERVGARFGDEAFLSVPVSPNTVWIWSPASIDVAGAAELPSGSHLALGSRLDGVAGFCRSHSEALEAQRVAMMGHGTSVSPIRYSDIEIAALMSREPNDMWAFVQRTLGPLADPGRPNALLRDTLSVYIESGLSSTETSRRLLMHRNTIHYRLGRIHDLMGEDFTSRLTEIAVALKLVAVFGPPE